MGRLKAWQNLNPLFSGKYKKLLEEYGSKDYSKLLLQESLQDFISYNCGHCGHIQKLQAEELNSIVGHAFRLAYAAHLQKSGATVRDVIPSYPSSSSSSSSHHQQPFAYSQTPQSPPSKAVSPPHTHHTNNSHHTHHHHSHHKNSSSPPISPSLQSSHHTCPRSIPLTSSHTFSPDHSPPYCCTPVTSHTHHVHPHTNTHTHNDQRPCGSPCSAHADREGLKEGNSNSRGASAAVSSQVPKVFSPDTSVMRTPTPGGNVPHSTGGGSCGLMKPPSSLPGLHYPDHENNNLHSPDSDTSNSPTDLNTSRRLGDKPPLIKNVNISVDSNQRLEDELNAVLSCSISTANQPLNVTSQSSSQSGGSASIVGYVNEKNSSEGFSNSENCSSEDKCRFQDDMNLKRISQNSMNSSVMSGNITLDVSSSSNVSNTPPPLPERSDSLTPPEEPHLKTAAWFQAGIPREIALEVLSREPVGAFMVRESTSKPGCYALSLRVPRDFTVSGIAHYLIVKTNKGYKIKGFTKEFMTLTALITHHSVMPELLPCPLSLSRYNPSYTTDDNNRNEDENSDDDPDYNTLSDFRKMMADLNV